MPLSVARWMPRLTVSRGGQTEQRTFEAVDRFRLQIEHFSDCILNGTPLRFPPSDGRANVEALCRLKAAADGS